MDNPKLDSKDLLLLHFLKINSRFTLSALSEKLNLTPAAIAYRLNKLVDNKTITQFTINVDQSKLSPTYMNYFIQIKPGINFTTNDISTNLIKSIYEIASSKSIIIITHYISPEDFKLIVNMLKNKSILEYSITPIVQEYTLPHEKISGENINIYCPTCQKSVLGPGFVATVGTQEFTFCCNECRDKFTKEYTNISK